MQERSLADVYASLDEEASDIYVVPLIRFSNKDSDYLFLLYKELIEGKTYSVHSVSVYQHFKLVLRAIRNKHLILHYHWLEFQDAKSLAGMPWKLMCIKLFKLFGGKLVWTLHNEFPHDRKFMGLHTWLHCKMASWSDALHVHCTKAVTIMQKRLDAPEEKFFVHPHPSFPMQQMPRDEAIAKLNEYYDCDIQADIPTLLMFGNISRYKQIINMARVVIDLPETCKLLIAGPVKKGHKDLYRELQVYERTSDRITVIPRFIKEEHVPWFYNSVDLCVFNYREILSSGGVELARSYKKRIVAPDKGCISELAEHPDVRLFDQTEDLKEVLLDELKKVANEQA